MLGAETDSKHTAHTGVAATGWSHCSRSVIGAASHNSTSRNVCIIYLAPQRAATSRRRSPAHLLGRWIHWFLCSRAGRHGGRLCCDGCDRLRCGSGPCGGGSRHRSLFRDGRRRGGRQAQDWAVRKRHRSKLVAGAVRVPSASDAIILFRRKRRHAVIRGIALHRQTPRQHGVCKTVRAPGFKSRWKMGAAIVRGSRVP